MRRAVVECGDGHQLFLRDWGDGAPIVFLAGWALDSRIWGETMLHLTATGHRTIAYDRRGHGRSTDRTGMITTRWRAISPWCSTHLIPEKSRWSVILERAARRSGTARGMVSIASRASCWSQPPVPA